MSEIRLAKTDAEITACFDVAVQLRTTYTAVSFLTQVKKQMQNGYQLAYLVDDGDIVCALAGYRYLESLSWGRFLYVDDLVTSDLHRSKGYGKQLLNWLIEQATLNQCDQLHLDSGVQRLDAHRFYEREKMVNTSLHYAIENI